MPKIICNTKEYDELLLSVMIQCCGKDTDGDYSVDVLDTSYVDAYEQACEYLT